MTRELPTALLMFISSRYAEARVYAAITAQGFDDITIAQSRLMMGMDEGGTRLTVLAERARVAKQTATALVDKLERAGYVERVPDPTDGRARLVRFTPRTVAALPLARAEEERIEADWTAHLGERRMRQLRETLTMLRSLTDPAASAPDTGP